MNKDDEELFKAIDKSPNNRGMFFLINSTKILDYRSANNFLRKYGYKLLDSGTNSLMSIPKMPNYFIVWVSQKPKVNFDDIKANIKSKLKDLIAYQKAIYAANGDSAKVLIKFSEVGRLMSLDKRYGKTIEIVEILGHTMTPFGAFSNEFNKKNYMVKLKHIDKILPTVKEYLRFPSE
jgi:hypothetical protein